MRRAVLLATASILLAGDGTFARATPQRVRRVPQPESALASSALRTDKAATDVERLFRALQREPGPIHFDPQRRWSGVLIENGARGTLTITPSGVQDARTTHIELVSGEPSPMLDRCWAWLEVLDLKPGSYDVRFEGRPCIEAPDLFLEGRWLVASPFDPGDVLVVAERDTGGRHPRYRLRTHHRTPSGFTAADGTHFPQGVVDDLRARVLASRALPGESVGEILAQPTAYLDAQGFDAETITAHLPDIRRACVGTWIDRDGRALPLPEIADPLFEIDSLRRSLAMYLLGTPTDLTSMCVTLVGLPGDPPIVVGTSSANPDFVPWYVAVGYERWHSLDRGLSLALLELALPDSCKHPQFESTQAWRTTLWDDPVVWYPIRKALEKLLSFEGHRLVAGWNAVAERFEPDLPRHHRRNRPGLFALNVDVRSQGPLDRIWIGADNHPELDWLDVAEVFAACEKAVSAQPWLEAWTRERGIHLTAQVPLDLDPISSSLWSATLPDTSPAFAVSFEVESFFEGKRRRQSVGRGVIAADGTLLIMEALPRAGLEDVLGVPMFEHGSPKQMVLVEPGRAPVLRHRVE